MINIPAHKDTIMVHCLATPQSWAKGKSIRAIVKEVTRWHVEERGWAGVAYAMIIGPHGGVGLGRDLDGDGDVWEETGAGAKGWNKNTIHIALAGGKGGAADDEFSDHFTRKQEISLIREINKILEAAGRPMDVIGHNQVARKACPCFDVPTWWAQHNKPKPKPEPQRRTLAQVLMSLFGHDGKWPNQ